MMLCIELGPAALLSPDHLDSQGLAISGDSIEDY